MKNQKKLSPFKLSLRVAAYGLLLSLALDCYLFATSDTRADYVLLTLIVVLTALLSVAVGFYFGLRRLHARERETLFVPQVFNNVHYPQRSAFEQRAYQPRRHRNFA